MPNAAIVAPPPLREGDRLTSAEFLRRWEAMPELQRAELIGGVVFMPSPVSRSHGDLHGLVSGWLFVYADLTPGCAHGIESTWLMTQDDVPQPDAALRILPECGGQSRQAGEFLQGAPELIVEISASTLSLDLGAKLDLYRRAGVQEYLTVLVKPRQVLWLQLAGGRYRGITADEDGLLRSQVFPGLWLDAAALWDSTRSLRAAVERGAQSPEHADFVRRLAAARSR